MRMDLIVISCFVDFVKEFKFPGELDVRLDFDQFLLKIVMAFL